MMVTVVRLCYGWNWRISESCSSYKLRNVWNFRLNILELLLTILIEVLHRDMLISTILAKFLTVRFLDFRSKDPLSVYLTLTLMLELFFQVLRLIINSQNDDFHLNLRCLLAFNTPFSSQITLPDNLNCFCAWILLRFYHLYGGLLIASQLEWFTQVYWAWFF